MTNAFIRLLVTWTVAVLVAAGRPPSARGESAYDVAEESPVSLRALLDVRIVRQGPQPSWLENGPGKSRYGGVLDGNQADSIVRFALSQFALEPSASLPWGVRAQAQLNWDIDIDTDGDFSGYSDAPRLIEGYLRREWGGNADGWAIQGGVMNPPFSLENNGPAWTPSRTLTPSAVNSWLWEEGRPVGLEGEVWHAPQRGFALDAFGGFGWGPDQMGILLAQRGWVLSDYLSGINSALPIPATGRETTLFDERDGRPAIYCGASVSDPSQLVEMRFGYFDNLGDLATPGVWETRYGQAGVALRPLAGFEILMQGLVGKTATRAAPLASGFSAWYPLLSYRYGGQRVSVRYDNFHVTDEDGPPSTSESGYAVTFAYLFEFWLRHRVAFEYIYIDSERPGANLSHMSQKGWQLSYRFRY